MNRIFLVFHLFLAILQRTTVNVGQIKIQGVATCLFLCMDSCGVTYGSVSITIIFLMYKFINISINDINCR